MKKLIVIALLLMGGTVWAQDVVRDTVAKAVPVTAVDTIDIDDNDTIDDEENVIGAKPRPKTSGEKKEPNVLGAPVYYDVYGNVQGSGSNSAVYHRPEHHYLNNLDSRYCNIFVEGAMLSGRHDVAFGGSFTWLRKRWGFYGSVLGGIHHTYLNLGAALRLSGYRSAFDWQLYGGVGGGGRHLGGEIGLRLALRRNYGEFCWTSVSLGYANYGGYSFMTAGLSLDLMVFPAAAILFL